MSWRLVRVEPPKCIQSHAVQYQINPCLIGPFKGQARRIHQKRTARRIEIHVVWKLLSRAIVLYSYGRSAIGYLFLYTIPIFFAKNNHSVQKSVLKSFFYGLVQFFSAQEGRWFCFADGVTDYNLLFHPYHAISPFFVYPSCWTTVNNIGKSNVKYVWLLCCIHIYIKKGNSLVYLVIKRLWTTFGLNYLVKFKRKKCHKLF